MSNSDAAAICLPIQNSSICDHGCFTLEINLSLRDYASSIGQMYHISMGKKPTLSCFPVLNGD